MPLRHELLAKAAKARALANTVVDFQSLEQQGLIRRLSKTQFELLRDLDKLPGEFWAKVVAIKTTNPAIVRLSRPTR